VCGDIYTIQYLVTSSTPTRHQCLCLCGGGGGGGELLPIFSEHTSLELFGCFIIDNVNLVFGTYRRAQ